MDKGLINYSNCITNFTSSIEKYYGLEPSYNTMKAADEILSSHKWKNVIVMLFDAMGSAVLEKTKVRNKLFLNHKVCDFVSCYPPTTATCTTAYRSGKNPIESGWIGWSSYIKETNATVETFTNKYSETKEPYNDDFWIQEEYFGYTPLSEKITKANADVEGRMFFNMPDCVDTLETRLKKMVDFCNEDGRHYMYSYWNNPDGIMHDFGTDNFRVRRCIKQLTHFCERILKSTQDTLLFVVADHGMVDVKRICFWEYPELTSMFRAYPSCDARTPFFFIKDGMQDKFAEEFKKNFSQHYDLYTAKEVQEAELFGHCEKGKEHERYYDLFGDFVAIARDEYYFSFSPKLKHFSGHHAGLTDDEMRIPLIALHN